MFAIAECGNRICIIMSVLYSAAWMQQKLLTQALLVPDESSVRPSAISRFFFSTGAYFVNGNTLVMSDLTDNWFYSSAKRIWLCIRLNNAGKYCHITLKIMAMLQNVCKNCVRILEEEKHRQPRMLVIL